DPFQPTLALGLAGLLVTWLSLMIPGNFLGDPIESIVFRESWLPAWWTWTHNVQAGFAWIVVAAVWLQDRAWRANRDAAWPDHLELLLARYPRWSAFREVTATFAAIALMVSVFHLVRSGAVTIPSAAIGITSAAAAGIACLFSAHRRW